MTKPTDVSPATFSMCVSKTPFTCCLVAISVNTKKIKLLHNSSNEQPENLLYEEIKTEFTETWQNFKMNKKRLLIAFSRKTDFYCNVKWNATIKGLNHYTCTFHLNMHKAGVWKTLLNKIWKIFTVF